MGTMFPMERKVRSTFARILTVVVILAVVFPVGGGAAAEGPAARIVASVAGDWFWTSDFLAGDLNISIYDSATADATLLWEGTAAADEWGFAAIGFETHQVDLQPGYRIDISDANVTKSLVLELVTLDVFDIDHELMAGTAPAGRYLVAVAGMAPAETQGVIELTADPVNGVWRADFNTLSFDIQEEMRPWSFVQIFDEDGDANEGGAPGPSNEPMWRDDFDGSLLPGWYWQNGDRGGWDLGELPGFLRLDLSATGTAQSNLLLKSVPPGDLMVKTHLIFEPNTNYQIAGLVLYQDENNFLQLGRAFCDIPEGCAGNAIYFDNISGGNMVDGNFANAVGNPNEAYLRIERRGDMVTGYYSYEGITWFKIGTHWIPPDFQLNAVGLTASQDLYTPDQTFAAYFDFVEITEGWGFLPYGFHDYDEGDAPRWNCGAGGWAADPDNPAADLPIEINVDGTSLPDWLSAADYREDLDDAGVCVDGNCAFSTSLWGVISSYEPHSVVAYAQDIPSGEWVQLDNSPKSLTCRTFDIHAYNPVTGQTSAITNLRDTDEYNPDWSPNGKKVAHDVVAEDGSYGIYITNTQTGASSPLMGAADRGNDAAWSPSGRWIAFDRRWEGDANLYMVPSTGGARSLIVSDAAAASWAPNGRRLVFERPGDGSLMTAPLPGIPGTETLIAAAGSAPAWSPDGKWIAYDFEGDIWKVAVNIQGAPLGEAVRLTSGPTWDAHPSWSMDSMSIIFGSGLGPDVDLWKVPAVGGSPAWVTGAPEIGDYNPDQAANGPSIAYASFSPDGQAARRWATMYILDPGTWSEGPHSYHLESAFTVPEPGGGEVLPEVSFTVSGGAAEYPGTVLLRGLALRAFVDGACPAIEPPEILASQPTLFHYAWVTDTLMTPAEALAHFDSLHVTAFLDGTNAADLARQEIFPATSQVDLGGYICSFTGN